jgi:hypothetical protein
MSAGRARAQAALAALFLAGCAATPEAPRTDDSPLSHLARGIRFRGEIDGPVYVAPPGFERAAELARAAQWPLPAPIEVELSSIAAEWRDEVERALFARGLTMAAGPGPEVWTVALEILQLAPDHRWLNSRGAEDAHAAGWGESGATGYAYALRAPDGKLVRAWQVPFAVAKPSRTTDAECWCAAGREILLASAVSFAEGLRPAGPRAQ